MLPPSLAVRNDACPNFKAAIDAHLIYPGGSPDWMAVGVSDDDLFCNGHGRLFGYRGGLLEEMRGVCQHCLPILEQGGYTDGDRPIRSFDSFKVVNTDAEKVLGRLRQYAEQFTDGKIDRGMCLHGTLGSGKTHLLSALYGWFRLHLRAVEMEWITAERLHRMASDKVHYSAAVECAAAEIALRDLANVPMLFIDDLGSEPWDDRTAWGRFADEFRRIVQVRYVSRLPIFSTMNLLWRRDARRPNARSLDDYGEREADRIRERCFQMLVNLPNYRESGKR